MHATEFPLSNRFWLQPRRFKPPQNCRCGRLALWGDCESHGGVCTKGAGLDGGGRGPVTPGNGARPVGLAMSFPKPVKERPAGLKEAGTGCRNGSGVWDGWDEKPGAADGVCGGVGSINARKRSMPESCSGVALGMGSGDPKGCSQVESILWFMSARLFVV